jgi:hypothetical protein
MMNLKVWPNQGIVVNGDRVEPIIPPLPPTVMAVV